MGEWGWAGIGWRNEKDFCQDYPIFLWLSTKHGAVSGGSGCNCGALGFCLPPRGSVHTWKWNVPRVCVRVLPPLRAVAFGVLIEIISMRIEPSQPARVLRDYYCATACLASPSAFTLLSFWMTEDPCNIRLLPALKKARLCFAIKLTFRELHRSVASIVMCFCP